MDNLQKAIADGKQVIKPEVRETIADEVVLASVCAKHLNYEPDPVLEMAARLLEEINYHDLARRVRNGYAS